MSVYLSGSVQGRRFPGFVAFPKTQRINLRKRANFTIFFLSKNPLTSRKLKQTTYILGVLVLERGQMCRGL